MDGGVANALLVLDATLATSPGGKCQRGGGAGMFRTGRYERAVHAISTETFCQAKRYING